jgi:DNA repair protein RadC
MLVSGIKGCNVMALSAALAEYLDGIKETPGIDELLKLPGLGQSKACVVAAMLEFGRRRWALGRRANSPRELFDLLRHFADRKQERLICVSLNGAHEVLAVRVVTIGLVNRTIVHPREVFAEPITDRASAVAIAHNHPSGEVHPSREDDDITFSLKRAAEVLGIHFLDHLIFTEKHWYSYRLSQRL